VNGNPKRDRQLSSLRKNLTNLELIGIDGCKGGWVVARSDDSALSRIEFQVVMDLTPLFQVESGEIRIIVDIPIGLSNSPRRCDLLARKLLGKRSSSVFPPPARCALSGGSYAEACGLNAGACGKKLSKQSFAIVWRIREVDDLMSPALQASVREAHPEVTFATLAGRPLEFGKKCEEGERERLTILRRHGIQFDVDDARRRLGRGTVARDDIIDAAACLVSAHRLTNGTAVVLPSGDPEMDAKGLRMEIVA